MSTRVRRRWPWWLLIAFLVVPIVEIYVIIQIGSVIGPWWTVGLLVADSVAGAWLVKREGRRAWRALTTALQEGRMPSNELADGALILIGGTLMLTPGFVTDIVAALLILPFTRPLARRVLASSIARKLPVPVGFPQPAGYGRQGTQNDNRPAPNVVRGDVVDD